jgi:hypothetical protein
MRYIFDLTAKPKASGIDARCEISLLKK